jgi:hypothetical protein
MRKNVLKIVAERFKNGFVYLFSAALYELILTLHKDESGNTN